MKTKIILFFFLLIYCNKMLLAQAGSLDNSFSGDGKVTTTGPNNSLAASASSVAVQTDSKIVVAGNYSDGTTTFFLVVRYNSNGTLDNSFGLNGKVGIDFFGADAGAHAVAIQPDGKIVVAGTAVPGGIAVARLNTDGTLDQSFSTDGIVITPLYGGEGSALALQADGKIVVAGYYSTSSDEDFVVVRYNSNGTLDHSFSGNGKAGIDFGGYDEAYAMTVQQDGKIVVAGYSDNSLPGMKVARLNSNGTPDNTFGNNGKTTIEFGGNGFAQSVAVQPNGYMVVAGVSNSILGIQLIAIIKLGPLGHRVSNFGVSGRVTTLIGSSSVGNSVVIQPDKKIIVAGNTWHGNSNYDFALVRYNSDGSPDNSFGTNGITTTDFGSDDDLGNSVALQQDGKIVVVGGIQRQDCRSKI